MSDWWLQKATEGMELARARRGEVLGHPRGLPFEREGYGVNKPDAWRRLYGSYWGYARDFGWRACFRGSGE